KRVFKKAAAAARQRARAEHNYFFTPSELEAFIAPWFSTFSLHDWRYLPDFFSTANPIFGRPLVALLRGTDVVGRRLLPEAGGNFYLFARRRELAAGEPAVMGSPPDATKDGVA